MRKGAYYNENDKYCVEWLKNLIAAGHIPAGDVDDRSIVDVRPDDLRGYQQAHFFAGLGGWAYAARLAGWPDNRPLWTGSCPCQPFSTAGKQRGLADERHLWPHWFPLIRECRPAVVFGEQVPAAIAKGWLDLVFDDMEGEGYACWATVVPALGVGAPHLRNRIWYVADAGCRRLSGTGGRQVQQPRGAEIIGAGHDVADAPGNGWQQRLLAATAARYGRELAAASGAGHVADSDVFARHERRPGDAPEGPERRNANRSGISPAVANTYTSGSPERCEPLVLEQRAATVGSGWWSAEPDVGRVAHGIPARVAKLRALGNAIVPQVAAEILAAYLEGDVGLSVGN